MGDLEHVVKATPRPPALEAADELAARPRCPFCHGGIALQGRVWLACEACLARHHLGCWNAAGRCATCSEPRAIGPGAGSRTRELDAAARRDGRRARVIVVLVLIAAAGALGCSLGRWWAPAPPPDSSPALRASLEAARVERARAASALALVRLGRPELGDAVLAWDQLGDRARHDLRYALGRFLLAEAQVRAPPGDRRTLRLQLEAELPGAIGPD